MKRVLILFALLTMLSWMNLGCGVSLGPQTKTEFVIAHPGKPVQILENQRLKAQTLESDKQIIADVGGWIAMPLEHWEVIKKKLENAEAK